MGTVKTDTALLNKHPQRDWLQWAGSGLAALGLNAAFFLLMPSLTNPDPPRTDIETLVPRVNVIRIKRPETKIRQKKIQKPPKPVKKPQTPSRRPLKTRITLPFEVNPRLPGGPGSLELPPIESAPLIHGMPGAFSEGQLDAPLTHLVRMPPMYPMRARQRGIEGWVKISFLVNEKGGVEDISVLEAIPPGIFESSVRRCARRWRFNPGTIEGMPVKTRVQTTVRFELE